MPMAIALPRDRRANIFRQKLDERPRTKGPIAAARIVAVIAMHVRAFLAGMPSLKPALGPARA
jgi:hypothetical protein